MSDKRREKELKRKKRKQKEKFAKSAHLEKNLLQAHLDGLAINKQWSDLAPSLSPCKKCGVSNAALASGQTDDFPPKYFFLVSCPVCDQGGCGTEFSKFFDSLPEAVASWNVNNKPTSTTQP